MAVSEMLEAIVAGAGHSDLVNVEVAVEPALSATVPDLLAADALVLLTPANIGYMSGALKHFFDTIYYPCMDATRGLPWGLAIHGNTDTTGAVRSVQKVAAALQWEQSAQVLSVIGTLGPADVEAARELGATLAAISLERRARQA
jgi:NAD(P)H-dependent FMN reductase